MNRPTHRRVNRRRGFTLIEILLVLAILVVVAGAVVINTVGVQDNAFKKFATTQVKELSTNVELYRLNVGQLPASLDALFTQPNDVEPSKWTQIVKKPIELDPWGHPYEFTTDGTKFEIRCIGPDGQSNTQDDIVS